MSDPFVDGHRAKAIAETKAAEAAETAATQARAKAKFDALSKPKPVEKPYVPSAAPWAKTPE